MSKLEWLRNHPDREEMKSALHCFHGIPVEQLDRDDLLMLIGMLLHGVASGNTVEDSCEQPIAEAG